MASRRLTDLHRAAYQKAEAWRTACEAQGVDVLIYCTYRSPEEQAALYAQGREPLKGVNRLRVAAGIHTIGEHEASRKVTWARPGQSWHNHKLAWDACPLVAGKCVWDGDDPQWAIMGEKAGELGIEWGGKWKKRDLPHFQYTGGLSLEAVINGQLPE